MRITFVRLSMALMFALTLQSGAITRVAAQTGVVSQTTTTVVTGNTITVVMTTTYSDGTSITTVATRQLTAAERPSV